MKKQMQHRKHSRRLPRVKRTRNRALTSGHAPTKESRPLGELTELGIAELSNAAVDVIRSTWVRKLVRAALFTGATLVVLIAATLVTLAVLIDDDDIGRWLKESVAEQTGGRLEFAEIKFSILRGINLKKIEYHPPFRSGDGANSSERKLESTPLLTANELVIDYSLLSLAFARLKISSAKLVRPHISISIDERGSSLDGIEKYRARHFPNSAPVSPANNDELSKLRISSLFPFMPKDIFLPFVIDIDDVGVEMLSFVVKQVNYDRPDTVLKAGPLDLLARFKWAGKNSLLGMRLSSERAFEFSRDDTSDVALRAQLANDIEITNFSKLKVRLANEILHFKSNEVVLQNLSSVVALDASFSQSYTQLSVNELNVSLLDALRYRFAGDVYLPKDNFDVVRLNIKQSLNVDLFEFNDILRQILPDSELFGLVSMSDFEVQGDLNIAEFSATNFLLPYAKGHIQLVDLKANLNELGITSAPLNGKVAFGTGPSLTGSGSQTDLLIDLKLPSFRYAAKADGKIYEVEVRDLDAELLSRGVFPDPALPILNVDIAAKHVVAHTDGVKTVDVPLEVSAKLTVKQALSKATAHLKVHLPTLLEAQFDADCRQKCEDFKVSGNFDVRSLGKLFGVAQPLLQRQLPLKHIPTKLTGGITSKVSLWGGLESLERAPLEQFLDGQNLDFNMFVNINDFAIDLPGHGTSLNGYNSRFFLDGNLNKNTISVRQDFNQLSIAGSTPTQHPVTVEGFRLDLDLTSEAVAAVSLADPLSSFATTLKTSVDARKISALEHFARPVNNPQISLAARQERLQRVDVSELKINIPDFGAEATGSLVAGVSKSLLPTSLSTEIKVALKHGVGKALPSGVRASGDAEFALQARTDDMRDLMVTGGLIFDRFSLDIPSVDQPDTSLLKLEEVDGSIPFEQTVDLAALLAPSKIEADERKNADDFNTTAKLYFENNRDLLTERENRMVELSYGSIKPLFPNKRSLTVKKISVKDLSLDNLEVDMELKQNWFAVNQFMVQFLGGNIHGGFQFAFDPEPVGISTTVHLTKLNTRKLIDGFPNLKKKARSLSLFADPYLDATMHLRYNLKNDEIDGGLDITAIGKEQLRMILYYIDPQESNPTISQMRTALNFGEVSQVSVPIKNGFIGLNVGVSVLSAPIPLPELRGFPIAQVVKNFKDQPVIELDEGNDSIDSIESGNEPGEETEGVEFDAQPLVH